jgi:hydrogenase maturation protein HypF
VTATAAPARRRVRARVEGTVQGVGFRPYVYRLARELGIDGHVFNDARGVVVEAEGERTAVERFLARLPAEAPPLARVERVATHELPCTGAGDGFAIMASPRGGEPRAPVTPDTATCEECLRELFDPADRRFRYPFVNCTNCGPRFTIVTDIPYDRPRTTMAGFAMCEACRAEYEDPADRRFHAQPNACPACGPHARLVDADGAPTGLGDARDAVEAAARALLGGAIVAVKGIGGYHLACRADEEAVVARLRARKQREERPFALLCRDATAAGRLVALDGSTHALLASRERPIVLARRRPDAPVAPAVAPRSPDLGVMLPYSPLHHLLAADAGIPLVLTSGNVCDEPIAYRDEDALARLARIADLFLVHDRPIHTRTDDSVVRAAPRRATIRRSRGYVPDSLPLPVPARRPVLACGAEQKNAFCLAKGARAWPGHHVGDLKNWETLASLREGVAHFERLFAVAPEVVAHDLHPDYLSTRYALDRDGVAHVGVQHHHAHLAACLAEHGLRGPAVGAIFDGTGYGLDGTVWGGELLVGDLCAFERAGHLTTVRMPGGERAIREPWRMACSWQTAAVGEVPPLPRALADVVHPAAWTAVGELSRAALAAPLTSSVGRLFDAVAALCGVRACVTYEGQAAVELEACSDPRERGAYSLPLCEDGEGGAFQLDARATIRAVAEDLAGGAPAATVGARFHAALAAATAHACARIAEAHGLDTVVLSGGVFANRLLTERVLAHLIAAGLSVLLPERLPANDGGIAFGQAAIAAARTG